MISRVQKQKPPLALPLEKVSKDPESFSWRT